MPAHDARPATDSLRVLHAPAHRLPRLSSSVVTWLALVAYLVVAKLLSLTLVPITFRSSGQETLFDWTTLGVFAALGLVGVALAERTGFPAAWDARVSNRQRLLIPTLVGLGIGALAVNSTRSADDA